MNQRPGDLVVCQQLASADAARVVEALANLAIEFRSLAKDGAAPATTGAIACAAAAAAINVAQVAAGCVEPVEYRSPLHEFMDQVKP